jgi:hypothetical protein
VVRAVAVQMLIARASGRVGFGRRGMVFSWYQS